jgi:ABC-2 type transport system ATP-binding protein
MRATCDENLRLHGRLQGMPARDLSARIDHVLEAVNLVPQRDVLVASLSAGMKARLRLARALLPGPSALILDEPTGAVDPIAAHGLLTLIMDLVKQERLAVLISSHRLEEIEALQSQALLLDQGRIKYSGDLQTLRDRWETPQIELVFADSVVASRAASELLTHGFDVVGDGARVVCRLSANAGVGAVLAALGPLCAAIAHVSEIPMPLRDLIAHIYAAAPARHAAKELIGESL